MRALGGDRDRRLDQDRLLRIHDLDRVPGLLGRERVALIVEQHVALAAGERLQRGARAGVLHADVLGQKCVDVGERLRRRLALLELGAVAGEDVPARASGRRGVRGDHVDARLDQVVPAGDVLGVALADHEHDDRVAREALARGSRSSLADTIPSLTRRVMSGVVENATTSAGWPVSTARLCEPDAPNDWPNETPLPALVCANAVVSASYAFFGVEYATSWSFVLPAPLVDDAFVADGEELLLVESEEPPHPARAAARPITMAVVSAAAVVRRDRALIQESPWVASGSRAAVTSGIDRPARSTSLTSSRLPD